MTLAAFFCVLLGSAMLIGGAVSIDPVLGMMISGALLLGAGFRWLMD